MYAQVLVEIKAKAIDKTFTYKIPEGMIIKVGMRVLVPFGKRTIEGFVLKIEESGDFDYEVKDIIMVIDDSPVINEEMLELGKYISKKTLSPLIMAYQAMLPTALKARHKGKVNKKYITILQIIKEENLQGKQLEIYNLIKNGKNNKSELNKISSYAVKKLIENGIVQEVKKEVYRTNAEEKGDIEDPILTEEQKNVISKISFDEFNPYLLYGVTGSGKTLVYIKVIEQVLQLKKEAILLVPEISLTPQVVDIFRKRFGKIVAILHSGLSDGEKYDEWRKIAKGEVSIVIGARSAIFAPFTNLGVIIIDEEHSVTYKQENTPKYNTIDVAIRRAKTYNIPLILGSATPSVESYTRALTGTYELLEMKNRVNHNLPKVTLVDMKEEFKKGTRIFSDLFKEKVNKALEREEQVIILLNRRGFSTVITCKECGFTHKCPRCDILLTYHKSTNSMKCHYCNYTAPKLNTCPECHGKNINALGMGTERLESLINEQFPLAKTVRMDVDTTKNKGAHAKIIAAFREGKYNVLVGTQMISKGLDFPNVTLACVVSGDSSLNIPDFRSAERTYQLLNQIAGRAGRASKKGEVIMQGFNMEHYSIVAASKHDYNSFYREEMKIRKKLKYPPFYNLAYIKISGKKYDVVMEEASKIAIYLKNELFNSIILGPSTANVPKVNNIYYVGIIIKFKNTVEIMEPLVFINRKYSTNNKVMVEVDLNPVKI